MHGSYFLVNGRLQPGTDSTWTLCWCRVCRSLETQTTSHHKPSEQYCRGPAKLYFIYCWYSWFGHYKLIWKHSSRNPCDQLKQQVLCLLQIRIVALNCMLIYWQEHHSIHIVTSRYCSKLWLNHSVNPLQSFLSTKCLLPECFHLEHSLLKCSRPLFQHRHHYPPWYHPHHNDLQMEQSSLHHQLFQEVEQPMLHFVLMINVYALILTRLLFSIDQMHGDHPSGLLSFPLLFGLSQVLYSWQASLIEKLMCHLQWR